MANIKEIPPIKDQGCSPAPPIRHFILRGIVVNVGRFTGGFDISIRNAARIYDFTLRGAIAPDWLKFGAEVEFDSEKGRITLLS